MGIVRYNNLPPAGRAEAENIGLCATQDGETFPQAQAKAPIDWENTFDDLRSNVQPKPPVSSL